MQIITGEKYINVAFPPLIERISEIPKIILIATQTENIIENK